MHIRAPVLRTGTPARHEVPRFFCWQQDGEQEEAKPVEDGCSRDAVAGAQGKRLPIADPIQQPRQIIGTRQSRDREDVERVHCPGGPDLVSVHPNGLKEQ